MKKREVVVVLPVYAKNQSFLASINRNCFLLSTKCPFVNWTIVIVNDGGPVNISAKSLEKQLTSPVRFLYYHYPKNRGKGFAVRFGLLKAGDADIFLYTDYDFPFGVDALIVAAGILASGKSDIVTGHRGADYLSNLPFIRKLITLGMREINQRLLGLHCTDTQAGLKGFNNRGLPSMLYTGINGFLFDLAFIRAAEQQSLRVSRIPVHCSTNLQMKNFRAKVLLQELGNLFLIATGSGNHKKAGFGDVPILTACSLQPLALHEIPFRKDPGNIAV